MLLNPLNVLKRKLEDDTIPLAKRLRLARNVLHTHHFPAAPKERIVAEWLDGSLKGNTISSEEFRNVLGWLSSIEDATAELKSKLIELTAQYLQINTLQDGDVSSIMSLIENAKITPQLSTHIEEYCFLIKTLLKHLQTDLTEQNIDHAKRIFNGLIKYYKESKKKLVLVDKILDGDNLETIFDYLDHTECREVVLNVCQTILFPMSKKSFFTIYLRTLLQKESTQKLMEEKGDNIQAVVKTMDTFFIFPKGRTSSDHDFLKKFIDAFVNSFKTESQLVFAFYIMVANSLNIEQNYINPMIKMTSIDFEENDGKIKRALFLSMLHFLLQNEVDLTTRLTETLSGNKGHIKKNFTSFLQAVIMTQLKLEGKPDKTTLEIVITALKLDPTLVELKLDKILPPLMVAKKSEKLSESYISMMNCLLEMLFKLSRGTIFVTQILPHLKISLEALDDKQKALVSKAEKEKVTSKVLVSADLLPDKCVALYGKFTSELMFRQNTELLLSLQKDFEDYCLVKLEDGDCLPSTSTLAQFLAAILSAFFERSKMADHTVPQQIAEEFWSLFGNFEKAVLGRFGECLLKFDYEPHLSHAFLKLSLSYAQLKLLNLKYSHVKVTLPRIEGTLPVFDLHFLLPCLSSEQWTDLCKRVQEFDDGVVLTNLLVLKTTAVELLSLQNPDYDSQELNSATKTHLINNTFSGRWEKMVHMKTVLNSMFPKVVFANLDSQQLRLLSKTLIAQPEMLLTPETDVIILQLDSISSNKPLLNALTMATLKTIASGLEDTMDIYLSNKKYPRLSKALGSDSFEVAQFLAETKNEQEFFGFLSEKRNIFEVDNCNYLAYIELLHQLQLPHLDEKFQLVAILVLLALKSATDTKKIQRNIDKLLQSIFEISPKHPDLYKLFPIEYLFDFEGQYLMKLLTLDLKTSNPLLLIKCLLETAVKKVKNNAEVVKILVKILLTNQKVKKEDSTNIEYFSDIVFQISCLILPIIAKEKKAITNSAFRTILAELQEKLHKALLKSFKSINLHNEKSKFLQNAGKPEDSETVIANTMATLDAMEAFSLTLSKYCETTDAEDIRNLDYLWSGLEFFVENAVSSIQDRESKPHHVDASVRLLNVALRNIKKLETHTIFQSRDKTLVKIWHCIKARLLIVFEGKCAKDQRSVDDACLEDVGVTVKFVSELTTVDGFVGNCIGDLFNLMILKKPSTKHQDELSLLTSHSVARYLWAACLKANLIERKCLAMAKTIYRTSKNCSQWLRQNYEQRERTGEEEVVRVDDNVCEVLRIDLDVLAGVVLAAKKIPLNYKFLDAIFETQHLTQAVMGLKSMRATCEVSWQSYFKLFEGSMNVLNSLLMAREELLEDRWPCYMQCYRALIASLCQKSSAQAQLDRQTEERLAAIGHSMEKLTQSISKRKAHISRLAAYAVADICAWIEKTCPTKLVRQHLENCVALLIQVSDSSYAMAFLRRALAGAPGQMTMTNMYSMYKRYHKYVGNA